MGSRNHASGKDDEATKSQNKSQANMSAQFKPQPNPNKQKNEDNDEDGEKEQEEQQLDQKSHNTELTEKDPRKDERFTFGTPAVVEKLTEIPVIDDSQSIKSKQSKASRNTAKLRDGEPINQTDSNINVKQNLLLTPKNPQDSARLSQQSPTTQKGNMSSGEMDNSKLEGETNFDGITQIAYNEHEIDSLSNSP